MHISPSDSVFLRSGRWRTKPSGELVSSWSGASIKFAYHGQTVVRLLTGPSTRRVDRFNGGTPTLCVSVRTFAEDTEVSTRTHDVDGAQELTLFDPSSTACDASSVVIELTLIDWASILEIQAILVEKNDMVQLPPSSSSQAINVLVIGDSISCGWAEEEGVMPLGCLSAFPFVLQRKLREVGIPLYMNLVAYPAWTLVDHEDSLGMESKFFHLSPWERENAKFYSEEQASVVIFALGTNDEAQDIPPEHFAASLVAFADRLLAGKSACRDFVLVEPFQDFNEAETTLPYDLDALQQTLSEHHAIVKFHVLRVRKHLHEEHTVDGLHLNIEGHEIVSSILKELFHPEPSAASSLIPKVTAELLASIESGKLLYDHGHGTNKTMKIEFRGHPAILRFGTRVSPGEVNIMKLLAKTGSIPVPRVVGIWESRAIADNQERTVYIVSEWIEGQTLEEAWPNLSHTDKDGVVEQLRGIIASLRQLPAPDGHNQFIGAVGRLPCNDVMLRGMGPFADIDAFIEAFKAVCQPYVCGYYHLVLERLLQRWRTYRVVLTHGDLHPSNVLVQRTDTGQWRIAAIIDWELAGWYPEHWEYVTLLNSVRWKSDWACVAQNLLERRYDDDLVLDSKYRFLLRL